MDFMQKRIILIRGLLLVEIALKPHHQTERLTEKDIMCYNNPSQSI